MIKLQVSNGKEARFSVCRDLNRLYSHVVSGEYSLFSMAFLGRPYLYKVSGGDDILWGLENQQNDEYVYFFIYYSYF